MKKLLALGSFLFLVGNSSTIHAQSTGEKVESDVKKGVKKTGNKTAELASKGAARVKDKIYKDKTGPYGETIYIDGHSRYYWIDKKGHHQYISEAELKDKM